MNVNVVYLASKRADVARYVVARSLITIKHGTNLHTNRISHKTVMTIPHAHPHNKDDHLIS